MTVRWSEQDLDDYLRRTGSAADVEPDLRREKASAPVSEKVFQDAVLRLAKQHGWMAYHTWSSKKSSEGFPDLVLTHREPGHPLYTVELKINTGQVTPAQQAWLTALAGCTGVVAEVWKPAQLSAIVERLRG